MSTTIKSGRVHLTNITVEKGTFVGILVGFFVSPTDLV
jgi:hypothetical protein